MRHDTTDHERPAADPPPNKTLSKHLEDLAHAVSLSPFSLTSGFPFPEIHTLDLLIKLRNDVSHGTLQTSAGPT